MFEDKLMQRELAAVGYDRLRKFIYRASWSTAAVEHFLYFGKDSRQYFTAEFGLRNPDADQFGVETMVKYGHHPNFQLWASERDATTCSMTFDFGRLDKFSEDSWPRVRLPEISGHDLGILVVGFVRQHLLPVIEGVTDLQTYLAFLLADREPHPWFASNMMIRGAQVVAVSAQLGRSHAETRQLLKPYGESIEKEMHHISNRTVTGFDMYVDKLLSDWASRMS
jgi:hypothetical protein